MASQQSRLGLGELIGLYAIIGSTLIRVAFVALRHYVLPPADSPGAARAAYGMLLRSSGRLSIRQEKSLPTVPTAQVIREYCANMKLLHATDELSNGAILHWIGPKPVEGQGVLLYLHGGGYNLPANVGHVRFAVRCAMSQLVSLVMLEYTLAPRAHFPTQSHQAIEALRHIKRGVPATNVTIAGDSAGAHLALCILSHINHPLPSIEPLHLPHRLRGLCLISPFLSFDYERTSYTTNSDRDILTRGSVEKFNSTFKPPGVMDADAVLNPRLSPLDAPKGWFKDIPVQRVMLTTGEREVMMDDSVAFSERLQAELGRDTEYEFFVGKREAHAAPLIDANFALEERESAKAIVDWMRRGA